MENSRRSERLGGISSNLTTGAGDLKPSVQPFSNVIDKTAKSSVFMRVLWYLILNVIHEIDMLMDLRYTRSVRW